MYLKEKTMPFLKEYGNFKDIETAEVEYIEYYKKCAFSIIKNKIKKFKIDRSYYLYYKKLVCNNKSYTFKRGGKASICFRLSLVSMKLAYVFANMFFKEFIK